MSLFKRYQKYIYALGIISFFVIYLGYSFTSGEVLKPDNPYEDNEEISKVSLREGLEEIKEKSDEETIENKSEVNEPKDRVEPESEPEEPAEPESEPDEPAEPKSEPEEPAEPKSEPEEPAERESEPEEPAERESEPEEPAERESEPEEPAERESEPEEPAERESEPEEPEEPAEPESEPEEPAEPESEPEEPAERESEPEEPAEPEIEPEEPAEPEIEPEEPAEPESEPEEPAEPESEPESEPEEPVEPESEPEGPAEPEIEPEEPAESENEPEEPGEPEIEPEEPGKSEGDLDEPVDPEGENEGTEDGENSDGSEGTGNGNGSGNAGDGDGSGNAGDGDGSGNAGDGDGSGNAGDGDGSGNAGDGDGSGNAGDGDGSGNAGDGDGSGNPEDGDGSGNAGDGNGSEDTGNNEEKDEDKPEPPVTNPDKDDYLGVVLKDKNNYQVKKADNITFLTKNNKVSFTINDPKHDHYAYQDYLKYIEYIEDKHDLKLNDTLHLAYQASVNGKPVTINDKNNFDAGLKAGFNRIKVELILKDNDGKTVGNDTKQFTIYNQNKSDLIIYTDIENERVVNKESFSFITYARLDGKLLSNDKDITVLINNKEVSAQEENNTYHQVLKKGENTIKIIAEKDGVKKEANFTITYEQHLFDFDDKGEGISEVKLFNDSDKIEEIKIDYQLYYENNGKLTGEASNKGSLTISKSDIEAKNDGKLQMKKDFLKEIATITLLIKEKTFAKYEVTVTTVKGKTETRSFFVNKGDEPKKESRNSRVDILNNPTLSINKKIETKNDKLNLVVQAFDFEGTQLKPGRERVELNGKRVVIEEKNASISQYIIGKDVKFAPGENKLVFSIRDSTGHETKETYTIIYNEPEAGDEIGTASISLEAGTLGLGTLASDAEIEIKAGENGADLIDRFLKSNGIDYESTGNRQADFYLPVIHKTGINEGVKIADELKKKLEEGGLDVHSDALNPHSLGEFDYTAGSGWMYSVNGSYPDIGFSDYYFEDGDDIRIRFTLVWGADIGNVKTDSPFPDLGDW